MRIGDIAKAIIIVLVLGFVGLLIGHDLGYLGFFGDSYLLNGFCISNTDKSPFIQSHATSFYANSVMAMVMLMLVRQGPRFQMTEKALRPIHKNAISLFAHGLGHLFLALRTSYGTNPTQIFEKMTIT